MGILEEMEIAAFIGQTLVNMACILSLFIFCLAQMMTSVLLAMEVVSIYVSTLTGLTIVNVKMGTLLPPTTFRARVSCDMLIKGRVDAVDTVLVD